MDTALARKLNETILRAVAPSGLAITVMPKPGFHKTEVHLAVGFGSIDEDGGTAFPQGCAHFLEHMLFENEEADPSAAFARFGAQVNAYTAADVTDYYFSTTEAWEPAADLLFRLVLDPTLPEARVAKEREIIAKEIQMFEDDVNDLIYEELLNALYDSHPVKHPIAGTLASLAQIDGAVLRTAHQTCYVPANMRLVVVGDVDPTAVIAFAAAHPSMRGGSVKPIRTPRPENHLPAKSAVRKKKDIKNDMLMLGIKLDRPTPASCFENDLEEIAFSFLFDSLFGKASPGYQELVKKGLVNEAFEASAQCEPDYGHLIVYTETKKPEAAAKALWKLFDNAVDALDETRLITAKRRLIGNYIQTFNNVSALAGFILDYELENVDVFALLEAIDGITADDVRRVIPKLLASARTSVTYHR